MNKFFLLGLFVFFLSGCTQQKLIALPASLDVNELNDANILLIQDNQLLQWDAGTAKWINIDLNLLNDINSADFLDGLDSNDFVKILTTQTVQGQKDFNGGARIVGGDLNVGGSFPASPLEMGLGRINFTGSQCYIEGPSSVLAPNILSIVCPAPTRVKLFPLSLLDNEPLNFGTGGAGSVDWNIYFDGTDLVLNRWLGTGAFVINQDVTQTAGTLKVNSCVQHNGDPNTELCFNNDNLTANIGGTHPFICDEAASDICSVDTGWRWDFAPSTTSLATINLPPGTQPTAPGTGDMWNDTNQETMRHQALTGVNSMVGHIFNAVADSTGRTGLIAGDQNFDNSIYNIPANSFQTGKMFRVTAYGRYNSDLVSPGNIQVKWKTNNNVILDTGPVALTGNLRDSGFMFRGIVTIRNMGAGGTASAGGEAAFYTTIPIGEVVMDSNGARSWNTAGINTLALNVAFSSSDADNNATLENVVYEVLN